MTTFLYLSPVLAALIAWVWRGEVPTVLTLVGGVVAILGVIIVQVRGQSAGRSAGLLGLVSRTEIRTHATASGGPRTQPDPPAARPRSLRLPVTTACSGPRLAHATAEATACSGPSKTASTRPSGRLRTQPTRRVLEGHSARAFAEEDALDAAVDDDSDCARSPWGTPLN